MARYIDPFTDTGFKIIFGKENQSELILKGFLNELFRGQPYFEEITELSYINNERARDHKEGKTIIHDIICTTNRGHRFIVEMQKELKDDFKYRSVYYLCRGVTDQVKIASKSKGKGFSFLPVVGVFICDFLITDMEKRLANHYMLNNVDDGKPLSSSLRCTYIQLPVFNKRWEECESKFDQWVYILKNMYKLEEFPEITRKDEVFSRLEEVASYAALTEEEKIAYEADLRWASEYEEEMRSAKRVAMEEGYKEGQQKGLEEGRAEGLAEGKLEEKRNVARTALYMKMDMETIKKLSGLTEEEILKLK